MLADQLKALEAVGLIQTGAGLREGEYRFRHTLVQEATYRSLLRGERKALHIAVGETLERIHPKSEEGLAARVGSHYYQAGDPRALDCLILAGDEDLRRHAVVEAAGHYGRALECARANDAPTEVFGRLYEARGRALERAANFEQALVNYEEMEAFALERGERGLELKSLIARATIRSTANFTHDAAIGQALIDRGWSLAEELDDAAAKARLLWNRLLLGTLEGSDVGECIRAGEQALELTRALGLKELRAYVLNDIWFAYCSAGDWPKALSALNEARPIWQEIENLPSLAENLSRSYMVHLTLGNYEKALECFEQARRMAQESNNLDAQAISRSTIGYVYFERGEPDLAMEVLQTAIEVGYPIGNVTALVGAQGDLAWVYASLGAFEDAKNLAYHAWIAASENIPALAGWPAANLLRLAVLEGDLEQARRWAAELGTYRELEARLGFIPFIWVGAGVLSAELALLEGNPELALGRIEDLLAELAATKIRFLLPDALLVRSRAHLARGEVEAGRAALEEARDVAEGLGSRRCLWPALAALADLEAGEEADVLRAEARRIVEGIAARIGSPALRSSFLDLPAVRALQPGGELRV